ncbi:MAG: phosphate/phosphite/phosphonate ABC transporter substrate-binding protein [Planctomycetota bacterium]
MRLLTLTLLTAASLTLASCGAEAKTTEQPKANAAAQPKAQPKELRFSVLPDWNKRSLAEDGQALATLLQKKLGVPVRFTASNDYAACVNQLVANTIDFVWLGGKTTCDAIDAGKGEVHVLATRDIDLAFKTYFIGNKAAIDGGKLKVMKDLAELKPIAKDLTFTFGDQNSTSGHLMPRHFLTLAGIDPDKAFKTVGYAQGGHSGTLQSVVAGSVDLGALNYAYYDAASVEDKAKAPILYTTPEYVDYAWVSHTRIGAEMTAKLKNAFLELDAKVPEEKAVLTSYSAGKFLAADDKQWNSIRKVRDALPKGFLK